jgi:hypothetical protein
MQNGSSKEEACSEEEDHAENRRRQKVDGEEDRHCPSQDGEEALV